jgi:hypothetical protein
METKEKKEYRINWIVQMKAFYEWIEMNSFKVKPHHISLYMYLLYLNNKLGWVEWFRSPFFETMQGACIRNKKTYYQHLNDLWFWGLIDYQKGVNEWKAPLIKIEVLKRTATNTMNNDDEQPESNL